MTAKTYPEMRKEFYEKFYTNVVHILSQYEFERKSRLTIALILSSIFIILSVFLIGITFTAHYVDPDVKETFHQFAGACIVFAWLSWRFIKKSFERKIKSKIMPTVCSCFDNLKWTTIKETHISSDFYRMARAIGSYNRSSFDDIFIGSYKDVDFNIVEAEYRRKGRKSDITVFDGVIIDLDMNKNFTGHTVIAPDSIAHFSPSKKLRHTVLEDVVFEKKFDVFTDDEVEARYLITPSFMERLNNIKVAFKADKIGAVFYLNRLLIVIHTRKDLFSLCSLLKPVDDNRQFFQMYEEIISIIKLIDHFKLDQKIGL